MSRTVWALTPCAPARRTAPKLGGTGMASSAAGPFGVTPTRGFREPLARAER